MLGLGHRTVVSHGIHGDCTEVYHARPRRLSPQHGLEGSGPWPWSQSPSFWIASFSFYTSLYPPSSVHVQVQLSKVDTCPISPYPKWLGVVVKAEKHYSIRHRVLNCSNDSLSLVPCRHTAQGPFPHQCGGVQLFLEPLLYRTHLFFQEHFGMSRTESSSTIALGHLDFRCMSSATPLLNVGLGP